MHTLHDSSLPAAFRTSLCWHSLTCLQAQGWGELQVVQAVQPAAMSGLREVYAQALNIVNRKQLRLYASDLRKAVATYTATSPTEPDMGLAHKRVSLLPAAVHVSASFCSTNF